MRRFVPVGLLLLCGAAAVWSYATGGTVRTLFDAGTVLGDSEQSLEALRTALAKWGRLAPVVYVGAVVIEVLVAPIPGTLLYAPGGALFGGFLGGTLSLIGNTIGAVIACGVGRVIGEAVLAERIAGTRLERYGEAIRARGLWVVLLLRINPLTSSDMVSYLAGGVGVPMWKVGLGTFIGMAPLCYVQAYLAETIFEVLPGAVYVLIGSAVLYVALMVVWLTRRGPGT